MGVVLRTESTSSSYNTKMGNAEWPNQMLSNLMQHDLQSDQKGELTSSGYNHESEVPPTPVVI